MDSFELKVKIAELDPDNFIISIGTDDDFPPYPVKRIILTKHELTAIFEMLMRMASENTDSVKPIGK